MPEALKGQWVVYGGLMPDRPIGEHTRAWSYTSSDYEADRHPERNADAATRFESMRDEALTYARTLMDPRRVNWVRVEFVWM